MAKYPFLSEAWLAEARGIYADAEAASGIALPPAAPVRVNLVVTQAPFSEVPVDAHVDTSGGRLAIDTGHLDTPDVTVSLDYATARSLFVAGELQAVMQAFLSGRVKVDGDLSKLLDPRSGLWPRSAGNSSSVVGTTVGPGAGPGPGPGPSEGAGPAGQGGESTDLGRFAATAAEVAGRLQDITE